MSRLFAHSRNHYHQRQNLFDHLQHVADLAAAFAQPFGGQEEARFVGWLHDFGKIHPAFQRYLLDAERRAEQGEQPLAHGPDHKGAGAVLAATIHSHLALLIAGHHGGLPSHTWLQTEWLPERAADPLVREAIQLGAMHQTRLRWMPQTLKALQQKMPPALSELGIRLLFSALVDADSLDTECHFQPWRHDQRRGSPSLELLATRFEQNQRSLLTKVAALCSQETELSLRVNTTRARVYQSCVEAATLPPGFFRLTVPTGGGKTRSSLAFALKHARAHGLHRIIYAVPYMTITEQTADTFQDIFEEEQAVLEHHSGLKQADDSDHPTPARHWMQLAAENWDAPIIVTTTVQLFESLFARTRTSCRKLHHIASSVIILDETQMLPPAVLHPILDALQELVTSFGVSVVLCTATQPALDQRRGFPGLKKVRDIVPDPRDDFRQLKRVVYQWPAARESWRWEQVAARATEAHQALIVVNTRADAVALAQTFQSAHLFHLSTSLCGAHRRVVLKKVREYLDKGHACYLISTQLIEAGINLDFPLVMRAIGPLDSIIQAAGRGNRAGLLKDAQGSPMLGTVIVFDPQDGHLPPGAYAIATGYTRSLLAAGKLTDADIDLSAQKEYFERYYHALELDAFQVQESRQVLDYPETAKRFRMIEEETLSVVVPYHNATLPVSVTSLLEQLQQAPERARELVRQLQPFMVQLRVSRLRQAEKQGFVCQVLSSLWVWKREDRYHPDYGLIWDEIS